MADNKVRFGLKNLTIFFRNAAGTGWDEPVSVPGIVQCNGTPQTNTTDFYADDILYFQAMADTGDEIELEAALIPDAVKAQMLGWEIDTNGALVRVAGGTRKEFAMAFETDGDAKKRRKVIYSCLASVPNDSNQTKGESVTVQTESLTVRSKPITLGGVTVIDAVLEEAQDSTAFSNFFTAVYTPVTGSTGSTGSTGTTGN